METRNLRKERIGVVVSDKMDKTIIVAVKLKEKHPIYGKFVNKTTRFYVHDEQKTCNVWRYCQDYGNPSSEQEQTLEIR